MFRWLKELFAPAARSVPAVSAPVAPPRDPPAPRPPPVAPRVWPEVLGKTLVGPEGVLLCATPTRDVRIQGVPCRKAAVVTFARNGRLASATLARAYAVGDETLSSGWLVRFEPDGGLRGWAGALVAPRVFTTRSAAGEACEVRLSAGTPVEVEWGRLRAATLLEATTIDGWSFAAETDLLWCDSGALSHATAASVMTLAGVRWTAGETVVFEFGRLREGYPEERGMLDEIPYQQGEILRFHDNGRIARCYLAADTTRSGVPCMAGTRVYLDEVGALIEGTLATDCVLCEIPVAAGTLVHAFRGRVLALTPQSDCVIDGIPCAAGKRIERSESGRLLQATLAHAHAVQGFEAPAGSVGQWRDDGAPQMLVITNGRAPDGRSLAETWTVLWDPGGGVTRLLPTTAHSRLDAIALREATTIDGVVAGARTTLRLSADGALRSAVLAADQPVGGLVCKGGTRVSWGEDGALLALTLAKDTPVGELVCARGSTLSAVMNHVEHSYLEHVRLHPDGTVEFATLAEDGRIAGIALAKGSTVARRAHGTLSVGTLAAPWTFATGLVAARGTLLGLFEDGTPSLVTLAAPFGPHAAGATLQYSAPGVLKSVCEASVALGEVTPLGEEEG